MTHLSMQQLEDLGFEVVKSYTHDKLMTQRRSKGVIQVETTWEVTGEFISQDLTIFADDLFFNFSHEDLKQLDAILNKK